MILRPRITRVYWLVTYRDVIFFYPDRETLLKNIGGDAAGRVHGIVSRLHSARPQ